MTLKEELETLRGEPIEVYAGNPLDIPCIETSDGVKLCQHPVVSVCMVTYNHEPYIRQAIEGVMRQKTNFEFELVIGEDASQDKTREICFEYQKKYPDKIRVLWWHDNVSKLGGNGRRIRARCRGEFVALCEGDDYWIDPMKLQKQVDIMRTHPNVGLVFCGAQILLEKTGEHQDWESGAFLAGHMSGQSFLLLQMFGGDPSGRGNNPEMFIMTATTLFRRELQLKIRTCFEVTSWRLSLGDKQLFLGIASLSDVYFLPDKVAVYRVTSTGTMATNGDNVRRDASIVRLFFSIHVLKLKPAEIPSPVYRKLLQLGIHQTRSYSWRAYRQWIRSVLSTQFGSARMSYFRRSVITSIPMEFIVRAITRIANRLTLGSAPYRISKRVTTMYKEISNG